MLSREYVLSYQDVFYLALYRSLLIVGAWQPLLRHFPDVATAKLVFSDKMAKPPSGFLLLDAAFVPPYGFTFVKRCGRNSLAPRERGRVKALCKGSLYTITQATQTTRMRLLSAPDGL